GRSQSAGPFGPAAKHNYPKMVPKFVPPKFTPTTWPILKPILVTDWATAANAKLPKALPPATSSSSMSVNSRIVYSSISISSLLLFAGGGALEPRPPPRQTLRFVGYAKQGLSD